ncbi:phage tail tube protein [Acidaminobacter hydrogenoformans]|uniref:Lambda phage tail tube protein N-terminal domain-containing protein n=1 Tax=Acidaminobacter hydrogenoformans DSM 2784 TaxID=1120920 RepID=A0A1G5S255_9FIRM|nr:phage tail tube protein [Acidaminobacter hydrogenoformans]SCZ80393.1 hypothetical protein SAMN03080599_02248 [Acidaminobacter hydrogenoformans DSM 2784]
MTTLAKAGNGTTLMIGATVVGEVKKISPLGSKRDEIDVTTLSSAAKEFILGMADYGSVTVTVNWYPGDAGQTAIRTAFANQTTDTYTITFPSSLGATYVFQALVLEAPGPEVGNDVLQSEIILRCTGAAELGLTASTGISALALSAGTPAPTFATGTLNYYCTWTSTTSTTVTVTAASHTIHLYVDGVFTEALTSGAVSASIGTFGTQSSKKLDIIVWESGKIPKVYTIIATRTT